MSRTPRSSINAIAMVVVSIIFFSTLLSFSVDGYGIGEEQPTSSGTIAVTSGDIDFYNAIQYRPGSVISVHVPTIITDEGWVKSYFFSDIKPVKCHWDFYDPYMHKIYSVEKTPSFRQEGSFNIDGHVYTWMFADEVEFTIPAFPKTGNWICRSYFIGENGAKFAYGPILEDGTPYMFAFPVVSGTIWDNILRAPIYILGFKTVALIWWLSPFWLFLIFFVVLIAFTRSVGGAVEVLGGARKAAREAREKWKRQGR